MASIAKLHLDHVSVAETAMRREMNEEDCNMNPRSVILLHQKRHVHLSCEEQCMCLIVCPIHRCLSVVTENWVEDFAAEKLVPDCRIVHLN